MEGAKAPHEVAPNVQTIETNKNYNNSYKLGTKS